jgi:hypothetical protein
MSIHTGEPVMGEEGYVGLDVHRAARICSAGHGGQVLLSSTTAALVSGAMPDGVRQVELGAVRLKDIDDPERVVQLQIDGLQASFPPLRTEKDEPLDFGEQLSRKIQADVERRLELSLSGSTDEAVKGTARLALLGLVPLAMLIGMVLLVIVVAVLLFQIVS